MNIFSEYMRQRVFNRNQNLMILTVGGTGSGKSYANLRLAQDYYKLTGKGDFPIRNVCFTAKEFMQRINSGELKRGDLIVWEEVGISQSSRNWYSTVNKMLNFLLQSFRNMNLIVLMNTPDTTFVDSQTRRLIHFIFETKGISKNKCTIKPLMIQVNKNSGKVYQKYLRVIDKGESKKLSKLKIGKPYKRLRDAYEVKKKVFTDALNKEILEEITKEKKPKVKKEPKVLKCLRCGYEWNTRVDRPKKCPSCNTRDWYKK